MSDLSYRERNEGYITSSKMKVFIKSPEAYFLEFIKKVPLEKEDSNAFILGTAFDDHLTYWPEAFAEKYFLDKWLTVDEMLVECEAQGMILMGKEKKPELTKLLYGDIESKIRLTATQSIQLAGMLHEANRQPLWDLNGPYEKQVIIEGMYKGMKLRGTLDRLSLEKKLIRDYKTTANLKDFTFKLASKYGYDNSMAFYFALVKMIKGVDCDVLLDVVQSTGNYQSEVFMYQKEQMNNVLVETIFPALDKLAVMTAQWLETGDEAVWMVETGDRYQLFDLSTYPMLETGKQKVISYI